VGSNPTIVYAMKNWRSGVVPAGAVPRAIVAFGSRWRNEPNLLWPEAGSTDDGRAHLCPVGWISICPMPRTHVLDPLVGSPPRGMARGGSGLLSRLTRAPRLSAIPAATFQHQRRFALCDDNRTRQKGNNDDHD